VLRFIGVWWVWMEVDLELGVAGGPITELVAELGTGFRFTGEFLVREKDLQRPVEFRTGTFMPRFGFSLLWPRDVEAEEKSSLVDMTIYSAHELRWYRWSAWPLAALVQKR
jgi:hypothetical protein